MNGITMLPIRNGALSLAPLNAQQVLAQYPGIGRVKPASYFGEDVRTASLRLGLHEPEQQSAWYERVYLAYSHYWEQPRGRLHCWQPNNQSPIKRKEALINSILTPVVPQTYLDTKPSPSQVHSGIRMGFEIPPVELLRRANALPSMTGALQVSQTLPGTVSPLFICVDAHGVGPSEQRIHGLIERADAHGQVWMSHHEYALMQAPAESISAVAYSRQSQPSELAVRYSSQPWEELSISIGAAHIGRLSGITGAWSAKPTLRGLTVAGAIRALMAERMGPILNLLPQGTQVHYGLGRIYFDADSSVLLEVVRTAKEQRLLPLMAVPELPIHTVGEESALDIVFNLLLNARYDDLHRIDQRALQKGGII